MRIFESPGRILVTGGSGLVGHQIVERLAPRYDVYYTYHENKIKIEHASGFRLRLQNEPRMCELIAEFEPTVVIHAAGIVDRGLCEEDWDQAYAANARATQELYELTAKAGARMVLISCAEVFDGERGKYGETDEPFPRSRYGKTKSMAEENILEGRLRGHLVIRTSLPFGWSAGPRRGFIGRLLSAFREGQPILLRDDIKVSPVFVPDIVTAVEKTIKREEGGLLHIAGPVDLSELEFGRMCARVLGYDPDLAQPFADPGDDPGSRRPGDFSLVSRKALVKFGWQPTPLEHALRLTREQIEWENE